MVARLLFQTHELGLRSQCLNQGGSDPLELPVDSGGIRVIKGVVVGSNVSTVGRCQAAGVKFHFKQWGEWVTWNPYPGGDLGGDMRRGLVTQVNGDAREPLRQRHSGAGKRGSMADSPKTLTVLSLGWGVQSWTLAAMSALGELPPVDYAIHADTTWEMPRTYAHRRKWEPWLAEHGVTVATVVSPRTDVVREDWGDAGSVLIPAFSSDRDLSPGQVRRQCTHDWKIMPIRRFIRSVLVDRGVAIASGVVESLQGISLDEYQRMRDSDVAYIVNRYPLVDMRMTRADCIQWLEAHGLDVPPKSACVFCPYKSLAAWRSLKRSGGEAWQTAVIVDKGIRGVRRKAGVELYVHPARRPLPEAVRIPEDEGARQLALEIAGGPCDGGHCGV